MILKIEFPGNFSTIENLSEDEKITMLCISMLKNLGAIEISENNEIVEKHLQITKDIEEVLNLFNRICGRKLPKVSYISPGRTANIKSLLKKFTIEEIKMIFRKVVLSDFLTGNNSRGWKATFDWIIKEKNATKILEDNYKDSDENSKYHTYLFDDTDEEEKE